ncbi:small-conductance mechanosensitive channel [Paenibacillus shirakamiensis]|uniref:Small-conductance mechanosensitive channel n=1 Tax=Paenibacillus shirakamiensis TaxID=1265935 RepID=A0ABS4JK72_9BACL|nr:small-conductance mechanosensitive channel [Paenibacillus shirakamiensis]
MKAYLITNQIVYLCTMPVWLYLLVITTMLFDNGDSLWAETMMTLVSLYPVVVILCSILSWIVFKKKLRARAPVILSVVPIGYIVLMFTVPFLFF